MFRLRNTKQGTQRPQDVIILCGTGDPTLRYSGRNVKLTTHIHLNAVFNNARTIPPLHMEKPLPNDVLCDVSSLWDDDWIFFNQQTATSSPPEYIKHNIVTICIKEMLKCMRSQNLNIYTCTFY
jgi:hypothetical protein